MGDHPQQATGLPQFPAKGRFDGEPASHPGLPFGFSQVHPVEGDQTGREVRRRSFGGSRRLGALQGQDVLVELNGPPVRRYPELISKDRPKLFELPHSRLPVALRRRVMARFQANAGIERRAPGISVGGGGC